MTFDLIEWATDLEQMQDWTKAEFIVLSHLTGRGDHPHVAGLTFDDPMWRAFAGAFLPAVYSPTEWNYVDQGEYRGDIIDLWWAGQCYSIDALVNGGPGPVAPPAEDILVDIDSRYQAHVAIWASKFWTEPLDRSDLAQRMEVLSGPLETTVIHEVDLSAVIAVGSVAAGGTPSWAGDLLGWADSHTPDDWEQFQPGHEWGPWSIYHPLLVIEILRAILSQ